MPSIDDLLVAGIVVTVMGLLMQQSRLFRARRKSFASSQTIVLRTERSPREVHADYASAKLGMVILAFVAGFVFYVLARDFLASDGTVTLEGCLLQAEVALERLFGFLAKFMRVLIEADWST